MAKEQTFEEEVAEFATRTKMLVDAEEEIIESEDLLEGKPPFETKTVDAKFIRDFAGHIGDNNPLYTDPEYAAKGPYGCLTAPPTIIGFARGTSLHGARRVERIYPIANYFSGALFQWYDVIRLGTRFFSSSKYKQMLEKKGSVAGRFFILASDVFYWNQRMELLAKARGHISLVPMKARTDTEHIGEKMLYERGPYKYSAEEIARIKKDLDAEQRRGAEPRYWEDVNVGDKLTPVVKGPFTEQDQVGGGGERMESFEIGYRSRRYPKMAFGGSSGPRIHPVSKWPWELPNEHGDYMLCRFRGLPGPFDSGNTRVLYHVHLLKNWGGDDSFIRKIYSEVRKPLYSTDTTWFTGEVVRKYKVKEKGEEGTGAVPGEVEYSAVDIVYMGRNQIGEINTPGIGTVYLPSRELGTVKLPIPHPAKPEYIPFPQFSNEIPDIRPYMQK